MLSMAGYNVPAYLHIPPHHTFVARPLTPSTHALGAALGSHELIFGLVVLYVLNAPRENVRFGICSEEAQGRAWTLVWVVMGSCGGGASME